MSRAMVSVGIELGVGHLVGLGIVSMSALPAVAIASACAVGVGILLNTNGGKSFVNLVADNIVNPAMQNIQSLIDSLESKLQEFFTKFDSNPSAYELVENPTLTEQDYQKILMLTT